ncbi:hypothetical protein [Paenibacillus camelliae]|uniref:hypothetical protein n=1 Tax=Paenibacillus camelliae TaxID=512410 RepID=UPI00203ECEFF|nr:hypothetical protein [Paenibacillus camelliae]MCM3633084.1 hypothetical protein [Paenibacillus camelliae]
MVEGYWTALCCVMLIIMIATGWKRWIERHIKLVILIPIVILIWIGELINWSFDVFISNSMLTISSSFIVISLLQFIALILNTRIELKLVALYTMVLALSLTMLRAFTAISPWAGANITLVNIAFVSGMLLVLLQLHYSTYALILFWGATLAEPLLMWQQRGEYNGTLGSLLWWDYVSLSMLCTVVIKSVWTIVGRLMLTVVQSLGKKMKS